MTSTIHVGNVTNSYGVAIGPGATAQVNIYQGVAFPRPNYRSAVDSRLKYYTQVFVGRAHEIQAFVDFVQFAAPGYLLVTANAGLGKSALMASLILLCERGGWPGTQPDLIYFFVRQQGRNNSPIDFLHNVNGQLLDLLGVPGGVPPDLPSLQSQFSQLWETAASRAERTGRPLLLLVDGLDEGAGIRPSIVEQLPSFLPQNVHVIVSSRPNPNPQDAVDDFHPLRFAQLRQLGTLTQTEIEDLLAIYQASPAVLAMAGRIWDVTRGEPLMARFVAEEVAQGGEKALQRLEAEAPSGVETYFRLQLALLDEVAEESDLTWDVLGLLVISFSGLTLDDLGDALGVARRKVRAAVTSIQRFLIGEERFELMHQQFYEVLSEEFSPKERKEYARRLTDFCARWPEHESPYAVRYYARHLAQGGLIRELVDRVLDPTFQETHLRVLNDLPALRRDLDLALARASQLAPGEDTLAILVRAAFGGVDFLNRRLRSDSLFAQARRGEVESAQRQLSLYPVELKWQQAAALLLAWSAAKDHPAAAQALVDQILPDLNENMLRLLAYRVLAVIRGDASSHPHGWLPPSPSPAVINRISGRFGGEAPPSGLEPLNHEAFQLAENIDLRGVEGIGPMPIDAQVMTEGVDTPQLAFVAIADGLNLVAFAADEANLAEGEQLMAQYIDLHASNGYVYYRNVSLWFLLDAVLRHPKDDWALPLVERIVTAALSGGEVSFREALPIAAKAIASKNGDAAATQWLADRNTQAQHEVAQLAPQRGQSDQWGRHKRTLSALAEAHTILGDHAHVDGLLWTALTMPTGFAGFLTYAWLTLAESIRICRPTAADKIEQALNEAIAAAQNIQEEVFCLRSTARVNAFVERWWHPAAPFDPVDAARRLVDEPDHADFAACHIVRRRFDQRAQGSDNLPLREDVFAADTLAALATLYQRPLAEFERLNRHLWLTPQSVLAAETRVNVPDPEFAPLLAARLAAELVIAPITADDKVAAIQSLVPIAARNPTTLDTVLARLFLVVQPTDMGRFATFLDFA